MSYPFVSLYFYLMLTKLYFLLNNVHCVSKNILNIFDCNMKTNYQILIIFGTNIPDTTGKISLFYAVRYDCLINITRKNTFC